jgi:Fe2+ transport system protein FeoA
LMKAFLESTQKVEHSFQASFPSQIDKHVGEIQLSNLTKGENGIVSRLDGDEEFRCKMLSLGVLPGREITVTRGNRHQPYLVRVGDCRVFMDWGTLERVYVRPSSECGRKEAKRWRWR